MIEAVTEAPAGSAATSGCTRTCATAWAGIAASGAGAALVLAAPGQWPALAGALLLACVPAGAAVMCWLDAGDGFAQAGLTLVTSLAVTAVVSTVMIWMAAWHPGAVLAVAALSTLGCAARLRSVSIASALRRLRAAPGELAAWWPGARAVAPGSLGLAPLAAGLAGWAYGVSQLRPHDIGQYGLLASAGPWFFAGLALLVVGTLAELHRPGPRGWLVVAHLAGLIVAIHATVPIVYHGVPEYAWVYKHVGVTQAFGHYGRVTNPSDIYQQWPALFAAVASVSGLARMGPLSFTGWGPLAFELADLVLVLALARMFTRDRRAAYLVALLYVGLIAWVGQDYLSPQAFGFLLWLGIMAMVVRWLLVPAPDSPQRGAARLRAWLRAGLAPEEVTRPTRVAALALVCFLYFAIVAAHQLTPYLVLAAVAVLVLSGALWAGWPLLLALAAIAGVYLAPRYGLIASQYGGIFSGSNPLQNAVGVSATLHHPAEAVTAMIVRGLSAAMWLLAIGVIAGQRRMPGRVLIGAVGAFSPFLILLTQHYRGEAIYRVYLFSAPWCALLIGNAVARLRDPPRRGLAAGVVCVVALAAGLQGAYGPVAVDGTTPAELTASLWLYRHAPHGSLIVLAADNFPAFETADYNSYDVQVIPADPLYRSDWLGEGNPAAVQRWIASFGRRSAYVVFSRDMASYAMYFGAPIGYQALRQAVATRPGWSVVFRNADATVERVRLG